MAVVAHVIGRGLSREQFDAVRAAAGVLEQPPTGLLSHVTWWEGGDCHVIDAWESEEHFQDFAERRLTPAIQRAGVSLQPEATFHPAHEVIVPTGQVVAPTDQPVATVDPVRLIRSGYEAFARGDIPAVLALFDPQIVWYSPDTVRFGGTYHGPSGVGEFFSHLPENFQEISVQPHTYLERPGSVVVLGTHSGRSVTGTPFEIPFVHCWTVRGGKATAFTEFFDTARMNTALGVPVQIGSSVEAMPAARR